MRFSAINPFGAIFSKELRITARRKRTYFLRFVYLGVLLLFLLGAYSGSRIDRSESSNALEKTQQLSQMGESFFMVFSFFTLVSMGILGPVLTSTAMSGERLHKTLPVLLMTPLSSWQIITGKLFSRLLVAMTLIGLSLPCLAVVRLLGGVELGAMFAAICLCMAVAVFGASIGLFFSTCMNRAYGTILLSYVVLLIVYALIPILISVMAFSHVRSSSGGPGSFYGTALTLTNPFFTMVCNIEPQAGRMFQPPPWWTCVATHLGGATLMVVLSSLVLRRSARKLAEGGASPAGPYEQRVIPMGMVPMIGLNGTPPPLPVMNALGEAQLEATPPPMPVRVQAIEYAASKVGAARSVSDNPVLWRELRRALMPKRWQRITGACCCVGLLIFTYAWLGWFNVLDRRDAQLAYTFAFNGLIMLLVCVLAGTTIAQERESDTWTLLLASPIRGRQIVWGKALGVMRRLLWPMVLITVHLLAFAIFGVISFITAIVVIWVILSFNVLFVATGTYLSLRLKKVLTAVALNLLIPLVMYLGVFLVVGIVDRSRDAENVVGTYLPYNFIGEAVESLSRNVRYGSTYSDGNSSLASQSLNMTGYGQMSGERFVVYAFLVGGLHVLLALLILGMTASGLDRIVGRAPQQVRLSSLAPA